MSKKIQIAFLSLMLLLMPTFTFSAGLVYECSGKPGDCTFDDLVKATVNVVNQVTIYALAFSVVVIAWAGFIYMTSSGNPGKLAQANGMFTKVAIGIAFIVGAWVIVNMIAKGLGVTSFVFKP